MKRMTSLALAALPAVLLAAAAMSSSASAHSPPRCDASTWDGQRFQSRVACYKSCLGLRVRAYCNSWCDRHCRR